ncbi:putative molybdenum carrier protein [Geomonas paludis]|uniref:Molybdenum carrier protein n=1 Tax=Geomonas paludis TaxID=2740185 RepID=A0ABY4LIJ2_9BACT|nr:putative molybdenum carrier protein [Geomonas paludis]UPU37817.1 putative molybdenum carrier protein [Geomonas paludis]
MMLNKIISGGQTGVDRAGLDAALEAGIPIGGSCPKGRLAEDGVVPACYPLIELSQGGYPARTERNVIDSDGTLILNVGRLSGGTRATVDFAIKHAKPYLVVQLDQHPDVAEAAAWIADHRISTLNVAGPRESKHPGVYAAALAYLRQLLPIFK